MDFAVIFAGYGEGEMRMVVRPEPYCGAFGEVGAGRDWPVLGMKESEYVGDAYFPEVAVGPFAYASPAVIGIACGDTFVKVLVIEVYGRVNISAPRVVNIKSSVGLGAVKCAEPAIVAVKAVLDVDEIVGHGTPGPDLLGAYGDSGVG